MEIIEAPGFTKQVGGYVDDDEYMALQWALIFRPEAGDVIPGTGGLRKLRWSVRGKGKRGGVRVVYYYRTRIGELWLLAIYAKSEVETLPLNVLRELRKEIDQ